MVKRLVYLAIVVITAVGSPSLVAHMVAIAELPSARSHAKDDGWRLTKDGWEQLSPRVIPVGAVVNPPARTTGLPGQKPYRWDVHPLAASLLLLAGAIGAFFLFPRRKRMS